MYEHNYAKNLLTVGINCLEIKLVFFLNKIRFVFHKNDHIIRLYINCSVQAYFTYSDIVTINDPSNITLNQNIFNYFLIS